MIPINKHLDLLGLAVRDRVTGVCGVVDSISFDLYGCIQAGVTQRAKEDGTFGDFRWYDVSRLEITNNVPVMDRPCYEWTEQSVANGKKGAAHKSALRP